MITDTKQRTMVLLRHRTRFMYDIQKLRIQSGNRTASLTVNLTDEDKEFFDNSSGMLQATESYALRDLKRMLEQFEIGNWLMDQRGIGETMAAVLVSYINIEKCTTVSKLWRWVGLGVVQTDASCPACDRGQRHGQPCLACGGRGTVNEAERLRKGEKASYDPWLKSKVLKVLGDSFIKSVGRDAVGYYLHSSYPNPFYSADAPKPPKPPKTAKSKKRKTKGEALLESQQIETPTELAPAEEPTKYVLRLVGTQEKPTDEQLRSVNAPPHIKTISVRRAFVGEICDPTTGSTVNLPWRSFYDHYKNRKENTLVPMCMGCRGTGSYKLSAKEADRLSFLSALPVERLRPEEHGELKELLEAKDGVKCSNCNGTGGPAPWGRSQAHRSAAAQRYMVKMFLLAFWKKWRTIENLPIRMSYAEEYLHKFHND